MLRKLFNIVLFGIAFLIMCYALDLTGMNTIGTRNLLGSIDGLGITFIHYHTDKIYDILASLMIIIIIICMFATVISTSIKKKSSRLK